jgi:hypothetical protein
VILWLCFRLWLQLEIFPLVTHHPKDQLFSF